MATPLTLPALDMETQGAIDTYAAMPRMPQKRRGLFGGKMDMEDFQMALARAAAYIQGDYEGAAAITGQMGKARQGRLDAAQLATMLAQDTSLTDQQRQMFSMAPDKYFEYATERMKPPERTNDYRKYAEMGYGPDEIAAQMKLDAESGRTKYFPMTENGSLAAVVPGQAPRTVIAQNPGDMPMGAPATVYSEGQTATNPQTGQKIQFRNGQWVPMGGGVSNGPGNFRP